jgi:hypothetical protein
VQWSAVEFSAVQCSAVQCNAAEFNEVECSGVEWSGLEWTGGEWSGLEWGAKTEWWLIVFFFVFCVLSNVARFFVRVSFYDHMMLACNHGIYDHMMLHVVSSAAGVDCWPSETSWALSKGCCLR